MKTKLLKILKSADGYISGQEICDRFGVTRTAIWKAIEQLKKEGFEIEAVRNKGYRLACIPDILTKSAVSGALDTGWAGRELFCYEEVDSTNTRAKVRAEEGAEHGLLIVADSQTAGKGRRGRVWESPQGVSVYMSLLLRPDISASDAPGITLVMALALAEGIRSHTGLDAMIKWPNDIVINKKKACGILTEMSADMEGINYIVTGSGLNVNQKDFPEALKGTATSLFLESGKRTNRADLIAAVLGHFEQDYLLFTESGSMENLADRYNQMLVSYNKEVCILDPKTPYRGISEGIDQSGALIVRLEDGERKLVSSGEVSVRGIYGYAL